MSKINSVVNTFNKIYTDYTKDYPQKERKEYFEGTTIPYEGELLSTLGLIISLITKEYNLEINNGVLLNLSVCLFQFIKENDIILTYDEVKKELIGLNSKNRNIGFGIRKNTNPVLEAGVNVVINDSEYTNINANVDKDYILGEIIKFNNPTKRLFTIDFNENGLLSQTKYLREIELDEIWPKETLFEQKETEYNDKDYKTKATIITGNDLENIRSVNIESEYPNELKRIIADIPDLIKTAKKPYDFYILGLDDYNIEYAFPKIFEIARNDCKERILNNN